MSAHERTLADWWRIEGPSRCRDEQEGRHPTVHSERRCSEVSAIKFESGVIVAAPDAF